VDLETREKVKKKRDPAQRGGDSQKVRTIERRALTVDAKKRGRTARKQKLESNRLQNHKMSKKKGSWRNVGHLIPKHEKKTSSNFRGRTNEGRGSIRGGTRAPGKLHSRMGFLGTHSKCARRVWGTEDKGGESEIFRVQMS